MSTQRADRENARKIVFFYAYLIHLHAPYSFLSLWFNTSTTFFIVLINIERKKIFELKNIEKKILRWKHPIMFSIIFLVLRVIIFIVFVVSVSIRHPYVSPILPLAVFEMKTLHILGLIYILLTNAFSNHDMQIIMAIVGHIVIIIFINNFLTVQFKENL